MGWGRREPLDAAEWEWEWEWETLGRDKGREGEEGTRFPFFWDL